MQRLADLSSPRLYLAHALRSTAISYVLYPSGATLSLKCSATNLATFSIRSSADKNVRSLTVRSKTRFNSSIPFAPSLAAISKNSLSSCSTGDARSLGAIVRRIGKDVSSSFDLAMVYLSKYPDSSSLPETLNVPSPYSVLAIGVPVNPMILTSDSAPMRESWRSGLICRISRRCRSLSRRRRSGYRGW